MEIDYNKVYKKEEIQALKEWFDTHELPQTMQIDPCTYTPNVAKTVDALMVQALRFHSNPNMYGGLYVLERIRAHILEEENKKEDK
jgi:hypothetical protein